MSKKMIRTLIVVVAVLVVIVLGVLVAIPLVQQREEDKEAAEAALKAEESEKALAARTLSERLSTDVVRITVTEADGSQLIADRDPELLEWTLIDHEDMDILQTTLDTLAKNCASIVGTSLIEDTTDMSVFGLDSPERTLLVEFNDDTSYEIVVGGSAPDGTTIYIKLADDDRVVRVANSVGYSYALTLEKVHPIPSFTFTVENAEYFEAWKDEEQILAVEDAGKGTDASLYSWKITYPYETDVDGELVTDYIESIGSVSLGGTMDLEPTDEEMDEYGLSNPSRKLKFRYTNDDGAEEEYTLLVGSEISDTGYSYVLLEEDGVVYSCDTASFDFMESDAFSMVARLLALVNVSNVDHVDVTGVTESTSIDITHTPIIEDDGSERIDSLGRVVCDQDYYIDGEELVGKTGVSFYTACINILVHSEVDEDYEPGDVAGSIFFTLNDRVTEESVLVEFLEYKTDYYALRVNGGDVHFCVLKSTLEEIESLIPKLTTGELANGYNLVIMGADEDAEPEYGTDN